MPRWLCRIVPNDAHRIGCYKISHLLCNRCQTCICGTYRLVDGVLVPIPRNVRIGRLK